MKFTPHPYQLEGIKFLVSHGCAGLLLDPGLGKTSITLAAFKILRKQKLVNRMLVVAPLRPCYAVWPKEAKKWDDFSDLKVSILHGPDKLERLNDTSVDIHVINPEGLGWLSKALWGQKKLPWEVLVVDESTRFKHASTQRFKILKPLLPQFARRYILTGSPAPNGLLDLFGQIYILDLGNALGRFITHYRMAYFDSTGYGGYTYLPRAGSADAIQKKIAPLVMRMAAKDYLQLPELINNTVEVTLDTPVMAQYRQMEAMMLAAVADGVVVAANAGAATNKCRQIANGGIYHEGGERWTNLHEAKADAVDELVEELSGKPALIAYEYAHDLERLRARFPDAPYIGGGVPAKRFREIEEGWNAGLIPVLLAQPQSVAHGLNLQGTGAAVIWHSIPWDLEVYEQFVRRVWRQGQRERVVVHHVVARGTVDEIVMETLEKKDRTQQTLLAGLKARIR